MFVSHSAGKKTATRFTSRGKNQHTNQEVPLALSHVINSTCEQREEPVHQLYLFVQTKSFKKPFCKMWRLAKKLNEFKASGME